MATVNMLEAKTNLSRLVQAVESGAEQEVIIARNGKPAARLVAIESKPKRSIIGIAKGKFTIPEDFDDLDKDVAELFNESARRDGHNV